MTINLPNDLENSLHAEMLSRHFTTPDEAAAAILGEYFRLKAGTCMPTRGNPAANNGPDPVLGSMSDHTELMDEIVADAYRLRGQQVGYQPVEEQVIAPPLTEAEFKKLLLKSGLMVSLPTPPDPANRPIFQPVTLEGEPLSETIIRERR